MKHIHIFAVLTGYHYPGCAKTFALMGQAFAEATLQMGKEAGLR